MAEPLDPDTWVYPHSILAARLAAGAAIEAVSDVMSGRDRRALCLVRPPGHHALRGDGMGFCIFANVSLAAAEALARFGLNRVLIVDFDVHHGNGTQEIFYDRERVGFLSIHRYPVLSRNRGEGRNRHRCRPGPHPEHPPAPRHCRNPSTTPRSEPACIPWPTASNPSSF